MITSQNSEKTFLIRRLLRPYIFLLFICAFLGYDAGAQPANVALSHIDRLGGKEGLSNSEVRCIYQDHHGFIWFGTYDGLNRFDGYDFRVYRNQPEDSSSIIHSYINCITEDTKNNLWVGTRQGVSVLHPLTETFFPVMGSRGTGRPYQIRDYIKDIKTDGKGQIYVASLGGGLVIFDKGSNVGKVIPLTANTEKKWKYDVDALLVLPHGKTYLVVDNIGLCEYLNDQHALRVIGPVVTHATCLYPDADGLWVGTMQGLYHFNLHTRQYDRLLNETNGGFKSNRVTSLQAMPDGKLWVGTDGGGIQILDQTKQQVTYLSEGNDEQALSSNAVYALYLDKENRKWIGTLRGGVNVIDDSKDRFQNIRHNPFSANSLISNFVKSVFEDRSGKIWIGTDGGGLSLWDRQANHFTNFKHEVNNPGSLGSDFVTGIIQDTTGKIWMATYGGGVDLYQPETNRFKVYRGLSPNSKDGKSIFWCLYVDHSGTLWVSGLQDGLFIYDRKADQFKLYNEKLLNILSLCQDHDGTLWAGNFDGIYAINAKQHAFKFFHIGKPVRSIRNAANGGLWLGTEAGLMYFDTRDGKVIKQYTTRAGLSNNNILSIEEDKSGKLWLSTYNGLCRFDPKGQSFTNFFQSDGLASKEFNFNASLKLRNGQLAFGGINGLTLFTPEQLVPLRKAPAIVFTDISIDGKTLDENPRYFKANGQNELVSLTVPFKRASLSFRYAAIEFTAEERIKYRYKLEGWDRGWIDAGHQRNIFYSRLSPGDYTLYVSCTNPEGQWTTRELKLHIVVLPPWYATIWAYLIYLLIVAGMVYWYLSNKFRETKLKYEIQLANANTAYQRNLQEKEKEINERRLEFFTGVSHEFRTPLSLIINPIKDLLAKSDHSERQDLNVIYRNAKRLLSLVDQLLLFRKADAVSDALHIAPMDIVVVCSEVYLCFAQQAKLSGISYELDVPQASITVYGDREKIEIVLFNLISNALKYTPSGKKVVIRLEDNTSDIYIRVTDGGPGIPKEIEAQIFEKFYRAAKQGQQGGFGIGLYLSQQFARRHHGELTFEDLGGQGTTFSLHLLKGTAHFPGVVVTDVVPEISPLLNELQEDKNNQDTAPEKDAVDFDAERIFTDKKVILVIDDDDEIRKYIRSILEVNYVVYEADNGQAGLLKAKEKQPDMIICDVMMPGLNGIELCATIKSDEHLSYIPMILLTASSSPESKIKGLESGADDYMQKPFEKDVLIARIANLLQTRDNLQRYFFNTITLKSANVTISDEYRQFLEKCIDIVERHLTDDNFSIKVLAAEIGMSHSNLYRKVKSLSGHTINSFIRYIRLRKAAELLIQSDMNVNEVAYETGFSSIKYFRVQFFKLFGANPSDFLKQKRPVFKKRFNITD